MKCNNKQQPHPILSGSADFKNQCSNNLKQGDGVDVGGRLTQGLGHVLQSLLGRQALLKVEVEKGLKDKIKT